MPPPIKQRGPGQGRSMGRNITMSEAELERRHPGTNQVFKGMQDAYNVDKKRKIDDREEEAIKGVIKRINLKESDIQLKNYIYTALLTDHYTPSEEKKNYILKTARSRIPKPLTQEQQFQQNFAKKQAEWSDQSYANYDDESGSEDDTDWAAEMAAEEAADTKRKIDEEEDFQKYLKECDDKQKCAERIAVIKKLHLNEQGLKNDETSTKRNADIRKRLQKKLGKEKVASVDKNNMTKEEAQKVIPTLELGDDIEEFKVGEGEDEVIKYKVITKSETTELHSDWRLMWKISEEYTTIKYYNPTFKLEIFEKPIKDKSQFDNEYIRKNLKKAYNTYKDTGKIIIWDPIMENGMVNIYEKLVDNAVFPSIEKATPDIKMGWDDTKDNERPYYIYTQSYKNIVTYEPPMHLLSSFSYNIIREHGSDEKVSAAQAPAGLKQPGLKQPGGKRKTRKQKQPKQKRAGSTKKTKKPKKTNNAKKGGKTSQKKGKQQKQKRGTRGKK